MSIFFVDPLVTNRRFVEGEYAAISAPARPLPLMARPTNVIDTLAIASPAVNPMAATAVIARAVVRSVRSARM
jgi:hypothetical protein